MRSEGMRGAKHRYAEAWPCDARSGPAKAVRCPAVRGAAPPGEGEALPGGALCRVAKARRGSVKRRAAKARLRKATQGAAERRGQGHDSAGLMFRVSQRRLDLTPQERAALIAWHLAHGEALCPEALMSLTGLTADRCRHLMYELSRVLPIYYEDGYWQVCATKEMQT